MPPFLAGKGQGWLTAEYAMLPRATHTRGKRDPGGRGKEIQRLIGRSLRAAVDLAHLGERTIAVDCDVLSRRRRHARRVDHRRVGRGRARDPQARDDRQASPTRSALCPPVAAVSVGIVGGEVVLDLPYVEDSRADVDMNVVGTARPAS